MAAPTEEFENALAVENVYISVGCNRTPNALDWGDNGLVVYGASHAVALYQPQYGGGRGKVLCTLRRHRAAVSCVRWLRHDELLSGAVDGTVVATKRRGAEPLDDPRSWTAQSLPDGAECGVAAVDGVEWRGGVVAVAAAGARLLVWFRPSDDSPFVEVMRHETPPVLILDAKVHLLPGGGLPVVAAACDDGSVRLLVGSDAGDRLDFAAAMKITGHDDWVRALAWTTVAESGDVLLASAAQDALIRVWRISAGRRDADAAVAAAASLQSTKGAFKAGDQQLNCQLETVLRGHENWVYGLHWEPTHGRQNQEPARLLSCSMDKTMIVWRLDNDTGLWLDQVRVGEVGGNTLGFYGCRFGNGGASILAHGHQGALHLWHHRQGVWSPGVVCGGHFDVVEDLLWEPDSAEFLVSVAADQTSRLHAPWTPPGQEEGDVDVTWHEMGRPQVHGYDLTSLAALGRFRYAGAADEKVVRLFEAPRDFRANLARLCRGVHLVDQDGEGPEGAAVPALGLSNKPVYQADAVPAPAADPAAKGSDQYSEHYYTPSQFHEPPTEETLLQNTLWVEVRKLYGHGHEVQTLASDVASGLLVSASRAQQAQHAALLVWGVAEGGVVRDRLPAHSLTVTQMSFAPDGRSMVSVSRDRTWALHRVVQNEEGRATLRTTCKAVGASRVLWTVAWSSDSRHFATGSRDRRVSVWSAPADGDADAECRPCGPPLVLHESVTAVAFAPASASAGVATSHLLAVGCDDGAVAVYRWTPALAQPWHLVVDLDTSRGHHATVKRLQFRNSAPLLLASCGADHAVKIYRLLRPKSPPLAGSA